MHRAGHRARDAAALAAVVAGLLVLFRPDLDPRGPRAIWVSPDGSDWRRGGSPEAAVATVQRAADMARPGDTVVLLPGVYRERLRVRRGGEPGRPVTFRAAEPGTAVISGEADPAVVDALEWRDEGGGIFSAVPPWPVYRVRIGPKHAYHVRWGGLERLRGLAARPDAWDAFAYVPEGGGRLHVFTRSGRPPPAEGVAINDPVPPPWEWGNIRAANVWVEADHVAFEGLRFEGGVRAGIHLWSARGVAVRECWFEGADYGVAARSPRETRSDPLLVERSLYHNYPQRAWRDAWLSWDEVYAHYPHASLLATMDDGVTVTGNVVAHTGDALPVTNGMPAVRGVLLSGNLVIGGTDDAVELDGDARGVRFAHNLVYDAHESLGLSPVLEGPVVVEENLFLHPSDGINGAQLKLLNPLFDGGDTTSTIRNVVVRNNTFVGNWVAWWGGAPVDDVLVTDNVFGVQRSIDPPFRPGVTAVGNRIVGLPTSGYPNPGTDPRWWDPGSVHLVLEDETVPVTIPGAALPGSTTGANVPAGADTGGSVEPEAGPGAGGAGAVTPGGEPWSIPRPGPSWHAYGDHPATARIDSVIAKELIGG